ncbi:N-acetylglucosamine-6-phosphate deacetylase [Phaeobacter inhibens]|uniref:N-acetylglucosamine-6-phosphate deacetylase n=1 Tax=Phaeobacter inhibens TaxID=221822 RepID=UPI0021A78D67|nr:amidohydrolase family protein [Phaeobacter inhibens]UWR98813.1 amidohydrolase family protein [Phaeobacter inhibens]
MENMVVFRGDVVRPDRILMNSFVASKNGRIIYVGAENMFPSVDVIEGKFVSPGYVDIHVHGGANADYMDGNRNAVLESNRCHARHGTTTVFPTTTTGTSEELDAMISACEDAQKVWQTSDGARIAGVHFYGPYFAEYKVGVHSVDGRRDPVQEEYEYLLRKNIVRIATCAAELPGALDFYRFAQRAGCFITCGHSNAHWGELELGFAEGIRHVDHFWCAMSSVSSLRGRFGTPMRAGMEQFVLHNEEMSTEIIADGFHLSVELLQFAYDMIGHHRLCLVTDANRALDCPPGEYRFGPIETGTIVISDGETVRDPKGGLASSMHGMDHMVKTIASATNAPLHSVIKMASLTPAQLVGTASNYGSLEVGKVADVILLSETLEVEDVFLGGEKFSVRRGSCG